MSRFFATFHPSLEANRPPASDHVNMSESTQAQIDIYKEPPVIKGERVKLSTDAPFTPQWIQSNLSQVADPSTAYASRIQKRQIVLENPARESKTRTKAKEALEKKKELKQRRSTGIISRSTAKRQGLWTLEPTQAKFTLFLPLHHLWLDYMSELLGLPTPTENNRTPSEALMPSAGAMHAKLVKADFHGSIMQVRQSKNSSLVGVGGIVIHETENAFKVITRKNQQKLIPKARSIFAFSVPLYSTIPPLSKTSNGGSDLPNIEKPREYETVLDGPHIEFELHGNQFCFRAAERAGKKFKHKETIEL